MRRRGRAGNESSAGRRRTTRQTRTVSRTESSLLSDDLLRQIAVAPLFQVCSLDNSVWYDPYDGQPIPLKGHPIDHVAEAHLSTIAGINSRSPLSWRELQHRRWQHELPMLLRKDPRFTVFGPNGQGWAEPFTGTWHNEVAAPGRKLDKDTIMRMARILAEQTQLALGEPLSLAELAKLRPAPADPAPVVAPVRPPSDSTPVATAKPPSGSTATAEPRAPHAWQSGGHTALPAERSDPDTAQIAKSDLDDAKAVQNRQLARIPDMPGYSCAVHYEGHSAVSGDIYAVLPYGEQRYLIIVGDVTGHGMQAALIVSPLLKTIRLLAPTHPDPVDLLATVNDEIKGDLLPGQFVTMAVAVVQCDTDMCEIVLAGHHPFVVVNPAHEHPVHQIGRMGMALGLAKGNLFRNSLQPVWMNLQDGDILLQCSDGILEAKDGRDREFGLARFWGSALAHCDEPAPELVRLIAADAERFAIAEMDDDVCVLALARPLADPDLRTRTTARAVHSQPRLGAVITTVNGQRAGDSVASDDLESVFEELEIVEDDEPSNESLITV